MDIRDMFRIKPYIGKAAGREIGHVQTCRRRLDKIVQQHHKPGIVPDDHDRAEIPGEGFDSGEYRAAAGLVDAVHMFHRDIRPMRRGNLVRLARAGRRRQDYKLRE